MRLGIVTATTDPVKAADCMASWKLYAVHDTVLLAVVNGYGSPHDPHDPPSCKLADVTLCEPNYLGTVPAFERGVDHLLGWEEPPDVIACLHDDFRIDAPGWDEKVLRHFERHPPCGLLGFGGAIGLGDADLYEKPYNPMQLARIGFRSNLDDAEAHGLRSMLPEKVACLDGFSQVGRKEFWDGYQYTAASRTRYKGVTDRPWTVLRELGFVHHFYDGALGALAKRYNWDTWYLPLRGHHFGGRTAVGDQGYATWAQSQTPGGDHGFWEAAHRLGYDHFRNELPIRV